MTPFFSIILPTYNRAHLIKKAIESVLAQTYQSWELIIVDDGSTDTTKEVVGLFNDKRIRYLFQKNSERSAARNNGISQSQGQYICFLDSDDYYLNNHLEAFSQAIVTSEFSKAVFITDVIRDEKGKLKKVEHEEITKHINNVCYILSSEETVIPIRVCIHADIFKEYQFNVKLKIGEDSELLARIAVKYPFIQVLSHTAVYHLHGDNTVSRANNPFTGQLVALEIIFNNPELKPFIPRKVKNQKLSKCYYGIAQYYEYTNQYRKMIWMLLMSLKFEPFSYITKVRLYMIVRYFPAIFR